MLWFQCDKITGDIVTGGISSTEEDARGRYTPDDQVMVIVPDGSVDGAMTSNPNFNRLRAMLRNNISTGAEETRKLFITPGEGKMMSYQEKRMEAHRWTSNPVGDPHVVVPIIAGEAETVGKPLQAVIDEVLGLEAYWIQGERLINNAEMGAKHVIDQAEKLPAIVNAANVDWTGIAAQIAALLPS